MMSEKSSALIDKKYSNRKIREINRQIQRKKEAIRYCKIDIKLLLEEKKQYQDTKKKCLQKLKELENENQNKTN